MLLQQLDGWPLVAFACGLGLMLIVGKPMIAWLQHKSWRKDQPSETWDVREDTPDTHRKKKGTPSMGGIGIIGSAIVAYAATLFNPTSLLNFFPPNSFISRYPAMPWVVAAMFLMPLSVGAFAALGFVDDWSKASGRGGLRARAKLATQIVLSLLAVSAWLVLSLMQSRAGLVIFPAVTVPVAPPSSLPALALLAAICTLVVVTTSNAVNLTDGIDGLAAGLGVQAGFLLVMAYFYVPPDALIMVGLVFWLCLAGACLGFLFFNRYPARVFMGDTGSLAIGAALGIGAILLHAVFLLPFIAFIYFVEMFSVIAQVLYFKWTKRQAGEGKRLFRRAPLHHHFELGGWSEWRVVVMFWFVNFSVGVIGLLLWHRGVLPRWPN